MRVLTLLLALLLGTPFLTSLHAQVTADFTSNVTAGCGSLQVSFTDLSIATSGNITSRSWDLGGVASTNQNPGRIFGSPGSYTICLTVTDNNGNSDTECKQNFITVYNLPSPAFSSDNQLGCVPTEITFSDESISDDGNIVQWIWGLGGTTGVVVDNGANPEISSTYENPDSYTISLTVTDDNGCVNSITAADYLTIFDFPVIDISLSDTYNCTTPFIVTATNNNPAPNVNYFWDFGNGFPIFEGPNPPSTFYLNDGSYTISVIAENSLTNCTDTLILEDVINIGNAVQFTHSPNQGCEDLSVSFTNTSFPWVTDIQWDFGDGNFSTATSPTHIYTDPGCYIVTLSALAGDCTEDYTLTECIEVFPLPAINFVNDNPIGCVVPHQVSFDAFSNTATNYSWNFGDGSTSTLENPSHTFTNFGTYLVNLEVADSNGCINSFTDIIEIFALEAQMDFNNLSGCSPVNFTLAESSISISPINSWYWEIDTAFSDPNSPLFTSTDQMPSFSIVDTGWYDITLVVTNTLGCSDTVVNAGSIGVGIPPIVNFEASPLVACVDEVLQFTDLSSDYGDWWFWDFGDGNISLDQNPVHDYNAAPDTFDITLNVAHNGCESTLTFENYIIVQVPLASFILDRDCDSPFEVAFVNNSVGADAVFWDFGYADDTDTSSLLNPVVIYPDVGCYTATQIVYNFTTGCVDSLTLDFCITVPVADFTLAPLSGCSPLIVNTTNNSIFDVSWKWSGSGATFSNSNAENPTITYQNPGIYSGIQLIVTDINNCQDTLVFTDSIAVDGVDVDFVSLPSGGCEPLTVAFFDNSSSFISAIQSWSWNIGNGLATSTETNTEYFFNNSGEYPVSLTVTNASGCESTLTVPDAVNVSSISALFEADSVSCPTDTVLFINISTGANLTYNWDFGDGSFSNEINPGHRFSIPGTYNVCLNISDFTGCVQDYCQSIDIIIPMAAFAIDTAYANCPPLIVTFENQSQNSFIYEWDFGDNSGVSNLDNPIHVYTIPGIYDVQLVASLNEHCSDTLFLENLIQLDGPVGGFSFNPDSACVGNLITFVGNSVDDFIYIWDFGDGVLDTTFNVSNDTISHIYQEVGEFVPKLTLLDSANCFRTLESPDTIYIGLLEIDFIASDSTLCEGNDEVNFINLINSSSGLTDLLWVFENGNPLTSTAFEPTVNFPVIGNFDVSLIVANSYCRDTLTKVDYIGAGSIPVADFSASVSSGCLPFEVQYFDQSTSSIGSITNWEWSFGSFGTANEQNPSYTFGSPGIFDVNLIVTTEYGCSDTTTTEVESFEAITPIILLSEPEICIGDQTQISLSFQTDTTGLTYFWQSDPTMSCSDCLDPFVNPMVTTSYFFISNTLEGCGDTSEIIVNVLPF
ncbi:MAG: PKD repeat protein, partial [Saprospiraceae bacterium]